MTEPLLPRPARFMAEDTLDAGAATRDTLRDGAIEALGRIHARVGPG